MEIQIADNRPALSIALGHAHEQGEERLPAWEAEMTQMVIEVTRKFHGSLTTENVRRGLETAIGILSLGLTHASEGGIDPQLWHRHLQQTGLKETSKQAVELVKQCAALPSTDFLNPGAMDFDLSPREHLLRFARAGYKALRAMEADRRRNKLQIELARWLLQNSSSGPSARRNLSALQGNLSAEDVFSYILPRQAGITGEYLPEETEDFNGARIILPPRLWTQAKKRFDEFAATLPPELKPGLSVSGESWFEIHVLRAEVAETGPSAKKPARKKTTTARPAKAKAQPAPRGTKATKATKPRTGAKTSTRS